MSTVARFSLGQYDRMVESGVFDNAERPHVELIRGEIREMSPAGPTHEDAVDYLTRWSTSVTPADKIRVRVQNSIGSRQLASAPIPDLAWVTEKKTYRQSRPKPSDVLLVIEVAETSLAYDRGPKADLYAAARIKDYWVVNLPEQCIEVYREPLRGHYRTLQTFTAGQNVRPLVLPKAVLSVSDLFSA